MNRNFVACLLGAFLFALSVSAQAQQSKKVPRIGYLSSADAARDSARYEAIRLALRERGYIEGQNIATEYRYAEGKPNRAAELAAELVRLKLDIIVVAGGLELPMPFQVGVRRVTLDRCSFNGIQRRPLQMKPNTASPLRKPARSSEILWRLL
jgi:hypothetical protein